MRIETERLILREFTAGDLPAMLAYWRDPRYQTFYRETKDRESVVRELIDRFVAAQTEEPRRIWQLAIADPLSGKFIGHCGVRVKDPVLREANIGYELNPNMWGRGYATEAARTLLEFGFAELGMHRVWAECVAENVRSSRVMERLGMRREAHFREHQWFRDRWWDTLIYAILDHEWIAGRERASP